MKNVRKSEFIINFVLVGVAVALSLFVVFYEYYAISAYSEANPPEDGVGYGLAGMLLYIFGYVIVAAMLVVLGVLTAAFNIALKKGKNKPRVISVVLIVVKAVTATVIAFFLGITFSGSLHTTMFARIVYWSVTAVFLGSTIRSVIVRKAMLAEYEQLENNIEK